MTDKKIKVQTDPHVDPNWDIHELETEREHNRETIKTMQQQIDDLHDERRRLEAQASDLTIKYDTTKEDLQKARNKILDLNDALAKVSFAPASQIPAAAQIWINALDAIKVFVQLRKARDTAVDNHEPWRRLIFDVDEKGQVTGAHLG